MFVRSPCCVLCVCVLSLTYNVDGTVGDKVTGTSHDGQNMSGYLLNDESFF
jgi:hypothetical protein